MQKYFLRCAIWFVLFFVVTELHRALGGCCQINVYLVSSVLREFVIMLL